MDSKSSQVSKILLSILANFDYDDVWMVPTRPLISNSSSPFTKPLGIFSSASVTISITVTLMFHSSSSSLARSRNLSLFLLSFNFTQWSAGTAKSTVW